MQPEDRLFPAGNYRHEVEIVTPNQTFTFTGLVRLSPEQIRVVALGPFGTTVFRLTEDLATGKIETEYFLEVVRRQEGRIQEYYGLVRRLLLAPRSRAPEPPLAWTARNADGRPTGASWPQGEGRQITFLLGNYGDEGFPQKVAISTEKFTVNLGVSRAR